jgi:hypothetical protein
MEEGLTEQDDLYGHRRLADCHWPCKYSAFGACRTLESGVVHHQVCAERLDQVDVPG